MDARRKGTTETVSGSTGPAVMLGDAALTGRLGADPSAPGSRAQPGGGSTRLRRRADYPVKVGCAATAGAGAAGATVVDGATVVVGATVVAVSGVVSRTWTTTPSDFASALPMA